MAKKVGFKTFDSIRDYKVKRKNTTVALVVMVTRRCLIDNEVMIITPVVFFRNKSIHSHGHMTPFQPMVGSLDEAISIRVCHRGVIRPWECMEMLRKNRVLDFEIIFGASLSTCTIFYADSSAAILFVL